MKINLGCGRFRLEGFVNVDRDPGVAPDLVHDLDRLPYPFEGGTATEILASHVLEHLSDPFAAVGEWCRILSPGGRLLVRVPHFSRGFTHPDHKRGFDVSLPLYFEPAFPGYAGTTLRCESIRLRWFAQPWLKQVSLRTPEFLAARAFGVWIDFWANLSPALASRLWGFWVGGFEEIEFSLRKPPSAAQRTLPEPRQLTPL